MSGSAHLLTRRKGRVSRIDLLETIQRAPYWVGPSRYSDEEGNMKGRLFLAIAALAIATPAALAKGSFPTVIALPNGFQPEGVATGNGTTFYAGSIPTGAIFRGDLRTGQGAVFIQGAAGRAATGLKADHGRLYVSGATTGKAFVYDARTGALLKEYQLAAAGGTTFINDVVVTRSGAYFTDSGAAALYRVPPDLGPAQTIPLTGDFQLGGGFNLNGIDATADGKTLLSVQTNVGRLFTIAPATGVTHAIDLHGATLVNGDGILLKGKTLYVVQNQDNRVAVVKLSSRLGSGTIVRTITNPNFDVPTTVARHGSRLYAVNARFGTPPTPTTTYSVVQVSR
jgi:sugar lactone lactonase YvrE